ncbi:MAG: isopentenyl-diphosphate Delta-isomerase [Bacteroidales bacterium]|nr:isopentenyl-diphosphate Delta-isomerase [Bacteroidales bacterium]
MIEQVVLVTEKDKQIGVLEKMQAHEQGLLHRAVSVLIFNTKGEFLLQKRAATKYHSSNLWTNATCTHPRPDEDNKDAAIRRLKEEMGLVCDVFEVKTFRYKAFLDNGLMEHELDHVFFGVSDDLPNLNLEEASDFKYISYLDLIADIQQSPENYTVWFKIILKEAEKSIISIVNPS